MRDRHDACIKRPLQSFAQSRCAELIQSGSEGVNKVVESGTDR